MTDSKTKTDTPKTDTPAAAVAAAQPTPTTSAPKKLDPAYAYDTPKQLRAKASKAEKAGDKQTAAAMKAAATLKEQQVAQEKASKTKAGEGMMKTIALVQTVLGAAYAAGTSADILKAIDSANVLPLPTPTTPFTCRISDEPPHFTLTTRGKKEGAGDSRPSVSARDLAAANVNAFLDAEGKELPPATVNGKAVNAHPVAYCDAHNLCRYDRDCANTAHVEEAKTGTVNGKKLTDPQRQSLADGKGLRHGDAASRAFATAALADTITTARKTDGSTEPLKTVVERIVAASAAAPTA